MKLIRAEIKNFRSIKDARIEFSPRCRILVGINESGKTNILKALALLDGSSELQKTDIRQPLVNEKPATDSYVRFVFSLSLDERRTLTEKFRALFLLGGNGTSAFTKGSERVTVEQFCMLNSEPIHVVDLMTQKRRDTHWRYSSDWDLASPLFKPIEKPEDIISPTVSVKGKSRSISEFQFVSNSDFPGIPTANLAPLSFKEVADVWTQMMREFLHNSLPTTIFWSFQDDFLLPAKVNRTSFANDPDTCIPLKNLFHLAERENISKSFEEASLGAQGTRNLLNHVAKRATQHLHSAWPESRGIKIKIEPDGENIGISVLDSENHFSFSRRSDGFKRFASFLLMVSTRVKSKSLSNSLILIDEPEVGLHPSGAEFLLGELLRVANSNAVVVSTHSIFMIDRENVSRHLIITKRREITSIDEVSEANFKDEEVLYNALRYSIFSNLQRVNILFEGWRDKLLFTSFMANNGKADKTLMPLKTAGVCHVRGVREVKMVAPLLEAANRRLVVLSDSDPSAIQAKKQFTSEKCAGEWVTYGDLGMDGKFVTGEDFLEARAFHSAIQDVRSRFPDLPECTDAQLEGPGGKIAALTRWLGVERARTELPGLKERVFSEFTVSKLKPEYSDLLKSLATKILSLR